MHCQLEEHANEQTRSGECFACERDINVEKFRTARRSLITNTLWDEGKGLQPLEYSADTRMIPGPILAALPASFRDGSGLGVGFGIGGPTGIGKTQALSALLIEGLITYSERKMVPKITHIGCDRPGFPSVKWSSWPNEVVWLRSHIDWADERVEALAKAPLLILDDIGNERRKGTDYTNDYGASLFAHIVDTRYRSNLPTIWSTNVRKGDLLDLLGAATLRRLDEPSPLSWIDGVAPFHCARKSA